MSKLKIKTKKAELDLMECTNESESAAFHLFQMNHTYCN